MNRDNKYLLKQLASYVKGFELRILYKTILKIINSTATIWVALITKTVVDAAVSKNLETATQFGIICVLALIGKLVLSRYISIYSAILKADVHNKLQYQVLENIYRTQWYKITQFKTGDLITRATSDVSQIESIWLSTLPNMIALLVQLITAFIILSRYSILIASFSFLFGPITILISWFLGNKLKEMQYKIQEATSELRSFTTESVQNIEVIKTYNLEQDSLIKLNDLQQNRKTLSIKKAIFSAISKGVIELGFTLGFLGATLVGAYKLYKGEISFGTFTAFAQLVALIQGPIYNMTKSLPAFITVLSSVDRLDILKTDHDEIVTEYNSEFSTITFSEVDFAYEKETILNNLSFDINNGDKIALLGSSGAGKTTIIRLLLNLVKPTQGTITVDSNQLNEASRYLYSYVPQKNTLFTGTILSNLHLANREATNDEINKAIHTACLEEFIENSPHGLNTTLGERMRGLSEGQGQRICIARALLHNTPILILDEATSALDQETEREIVKRIKELYPEKTLIAVTHRHEIKNICNKEVYLKNGQAKIN